jgi:3',5'-cyclic AMP phosphodiesterase CpdA
MDPQPDFALVTGDLTDAWRPDQVARFKALALGALRPEVVVASGNHDVGFDPRPKHITQWLTAFPEATLPQVVERGPVTFIGFDSQIYNARRTSPEVDALAEAQWERLVDAVKKARARGKRVMLYCHIPAVPSFFRKKVRASWKGTYLPRFLALLRDHQVEATLTGHFHRDELYAVGPTLFLNAPPVSRWETRDTSYRVIKITDEGMVYRQIYIGPEARTRSYEADLRSVTEAGVTAWVQALDGDELRALWERRYAGDDASQRLYGDLEQAIFRDFLTRPFHYQPKDDDTTWFGGPPP